MRKAVILISAVALVFSVSLVGAADVEALKKDLAGALSSKSWTQAKDLIREIGALNNAAAARAIIGNLGKMISNSEVLDAAKSALSSMSDPAAVKTIASHAATARPFQAQVVLAEALGSMGGKEALSALLKLLRNRNTVVAKTAARSLGEMGDPNAIKPLIDAMKKWQKTKTGPYFDINTALQKITGKNIDDYLDWKSWFGSGEGLEDLQPGNYTAGIVAEGQKGGTSVFGLKVDSRRVVVIIDVSGSMELRDPLPEGAVAGGGDDDDFSTDVEDAKKKKTEEERKKAENEAKAKAEREGLEAERMRIKRAKKQLIKMIKSFDPTVKFNIIAYSDEVKCWKKKLEFAKDAAKQSAIAFVKKLEPDGLTWTDSAIETAFKDKEIDTIILISDGAPMHAPFAGGSQLPAESLQIMEDILNWLDKNNRFRKVTLHTIGFPGAEKDWMRKLAKQNNGTFKDIK